MRLNTRPVLAGFVLGAIAAIAIVLLPRTAIESLGNRTHLADIWDVAKPPLGTKARILIALIPFFIAAIAGVVLGFVMGRKKTDDDDYGAYPDYDLGPAPVADPFAPTEEVPYSAPPQPAISEAAPAETIAALPEAPPPAPVYAPPPAPAATAPAPADVATAADVAELAEAIVKLTGRLDAVEAKLAAQPAGGGGAKLSPELAERLAKIVRALDDAG